MDAFDSDSLNEGRAAFSVTRVLAVVLDEAADEAQDLVVRGDGRQQVGGAHAQARSASNVDLPAAWDGHRTNILDGGLCAVARASAHGQLHLVRRLDSLKLGLDGD